MRLQYNDTGDLTDAYCPCGWAASVSPALTGRLASAVQDHRCARATPVTRQLIVDSHGASFTTPRYRWDWRRPGAWLPLSMRDPGPPAFEPDYSRAYLWPAVPERKTWRGWWGTLQRTDMTEAATATRETP